MALGETVGLWPGRRGLRGARPGTLAAPPFPDVRELRPLTAPPAQRATVVDLALWTVGAGRDAVPLAVARRAVPGALPDPAGPARPACPGAPLDAARESLRRGRYAEAAASARRALWTGREPERAEALWTGREPERAEALWILAVALWQGPEPASAAVFRLRTLWAEHADGRPAARLVLAGPLAVLHAMREREPEARAALAEARAAAAEVDPAGGAVLLPLLTAEVESLAGRPERSLHLLEEAAQAAAPLGLERLRTAVDRAVVRRRGELYPEGVRRLGDGGWPGETGGPEREVGRGCAAEAVAAAGRAVAEAVATDSPVAQALARLDRAEALRWAGRPQDARREVCLAGLCFARKGHVPGVSRAAARHAALASA
ncbi:hypothetical protein [Streptomyces sp. NPDC047028]|uniref:hypothetical protein n=1 Tax=Streptomyces sp. NPDC047028 TaxID=3155793 RepID=UPI0033EF15EB